MTTLQQIIRDSVYEEIEHRDKRMTHIVKVAHTRLVVGLGSSPIIIAEFDKEAVYIYAALYPTIQSQLRKPKYRQERHRIRLELIRNSYTNKLFYYEVQWEGQNGSHTIEYAKPDAILEIQYFMNKLITIARRSTSKKSGFFQLSDASQYPNILKLAKDQYQTKVLNQRKKNP